MSNVVSLQPSLAIGFLREGAQESRQPRVETDKEAIARACLEKVAALTASDGEIQLPALPALVDEYTDRLIRLFEALSRRFEAPEREHLRRILEEKTTWAFEQSPDAVICITYKTNPPPAVTLHYDIHSRFFTSEEAYANWVRTRPAPLFGKHPDARVMDLVEELGGPGRVTCLDVGAGTGRNALPLARAGYETDAIEPAPALADILEETAREEGLSVGIARGSLGDRSLPLRDHYRFIVLAEVCSHFRGVDDLRAAFMRLAELLDPGGVALINLFMAAPAYTPDRLARDFSETAWCKTVTYKELRAATEGLGLELVSDDCQHDYEKARLPEDAWPPTGWYVSWTTGRDLFNMKSGGRAPVELRWLTFRRSAGSSVAAPPSPRTRESGALRPAVLREAILLNVAGRTAAAGAVTFPAAPALVDSYTTAIGRMLGALYRPFTATDRNNLRNALYQLASQAAAASPVAKLRVTYRLQMPPAAHFNLDAALILPDEAPVDIIASLGDRIPDARVLHAARDLGAADTVSCLEVGAGMGRNALALARAGHAVDAVETVPFFAEALASAASQRRLPIEVRQGSFLDRSLALPRPRYRFIVVSELCARLRDRETLRDVFTRFTELLEPGGTGLVSLFVAAERYTPSRLVREMADHLGCPFVDRRELTELLAGLPLRIASDVGKHAYERAHPPSDDSPPSDAYASWATGRDLFALPEEKTPPVDLRWLLLKRTT